LNYTRMHVLLKKQRQNNHRHGLCFTPATNLIAFADMNENRYPIKK